MVNQTKLALVWYWGIGYFSSCEKVYFLVSFRVWFPELHMVVLLARLQDVIDVSFHSCWSSSEQPTSQCLTKNNTALPMLCWDFGPRDPSPRNPHVDFFASTSPSSDPAVMPGPKMCFFCRFVRFQFVFTKGTKCDMATSALSKQHVIWPWKCLSV